MSDTLSQNQGFLIAAPQSGSGKTVLTLGILRALYNRGVGLKPAKAGPDFIDPAFHAAASHVKCVNFDPWAMRPELLHHLASQKANDVLVVEGMMGLFDGAASGEGSAADLASLLGLPVVLVVDCAKQSHSIAALVSGFLNHRPHLSFGGIILNRVGSARHESLLRDALEPLGIAVLGCVFRDEKLATPSRHLGLVQAREREGLEAFLQHAAAIAERQIDLDALLKLVVGSSLYGSEAPSFLKPIGQHIAIADDAAFAFTYPHILEGWRQAGASFSFFSPLVNEGPPDKCDAVFLPGGYPELHGETLAAADQFKAGMKRMAERGCALYGECGGFMVLGQHLVDAQGVAHPMLGLLPHSTSFETRKLYLGYRRATTLNDSPLGQVGSSFTAHEFHYSSLIGQGVEDSLPLFACEDARGEDLGALGLVRGRVAGSYLHVIDRA